MKKGKVVSCVGGTYSIYCDGIIYNVIAKGIFRFKNKQIIVGDNVLFDDELCVINEIEERTNQIIRPKVCNIDQMIIVMSLKQPDFSKELLFKFLTYASFNDVKSSVVLTKYDLVDNQSIIDDIVNELNYLNINCYLISKKVEGHGELNRLIKDIDNKITIFMGQTGVGKSSLINLLDESFNRSIGEYSLALGRGKHQTKEVILLPYRNGFIGDTPGFSSLDLNMNKIQLAHYFPGFKQLNYEQCYFSNCLHHLEKQCNIKKAVEENKYPQQLYEIYLKLLDNIDDNKRN